MEINIEYPCGYKQNIKSGPFDWFFSLKAKDDGKGCPIHGKNCRRK